MNLLRRFTTVVCVLLESSRSAFSRLFWSPQSRLPANRFQAFLYSNAAVTDDGSPVIARLTRKLIDLVPKRRMVYFVTVS
ncbi:hypothetical protein Zmor_007353 [Zophobas morio]|uniref:Uncharacterized protein n=1 Tax=Zophobas morio TaxID=2755281 RepID=A0AA38J1P7_9CUCU|nr:hypothetical protein Zmor_007353 [Zophobas morio]